MSKYTIIGSLNYDLVTITNRIPTGGETIQSEAFETHIGGKGLNQCISVSKLTSSKKNKDLFPDGVKVRLVGCLGDDSFGKEILGHLSQFPIDLKDVSVLKGVRTGVAVILIEKKTGENRIMINPGANGNTGSFVLEDIFPPEDKEDDHFVVFQNEIPNVPAIIEWISNNRPGYNITYNPSPFYNYSVRCLNNTDVLIVNEGEAISLLRSLVSEDQKLLDSWFTEFSEDEINVSWFVKVAKFLNEKMNKRNLNLVVITLGPHGSVYSYQTSFSGIVPSVRVVNILDTTGAGDTFLGSVIAQLGSLLQKTGNIDQTNIEEILRFSTLASSIAIQRLGASDSIPYYDEVLDK